MPTNDERRTAALAALDVILRLAPSGPFVIFRDDGSAKRLTPNGARFLTMLCAPLGGSGHHVTEDGIRGYLGMSHRPLAEWRTVAALPAFDEDLHTRAMEKAAAVREGKWRPGWQPGFANK